MGSVEYTLLIDRMCCSFELLHMVFFQAEQQMCMYSVV